MVVGPARCYAYRAPRSKWKVRQIMDSALGRCRFSGGWQRSRLSGALAALIKGDSFGANNKIPKDSYLANVNNHVLVRHSLRADSCFSIGREVRAQERSYR